MAYALNVSVCQLNPVVGDLSWNLARIMHEVDSALKAQGGCDVVVFPEMATVGYPARDLLYSHSFWTEQQKAIEGLAHYVQGLDGQITVIVGGLDLVRDTYGRERRYNAAWIIDRKYGVRVVHKRLLPCYDVFDETRYFASNQHEPILPIPIELQSGKTINVDVLICEDIWNHRFQNPSWMMPVGYEVDPTQNLHGDGPIFILNASPWWQGKVQQTHSLLRSISGAYESRPVVWVNQVGANDDVITGGYSCVVTTYKGNQQILSMAPFIEAIAVFEICQQESGVCCPPFMAATRCLTQNAVANIRDMPRLLNEPMVSEGDNLEDFNSWCLYQAYLLYIRDYCSKCGFEKVIVAQSGGIDSALTTVLAVHALGPDQVEVITMPSKYSSQGSIEDSYELARNLGVKITTLPIDSAHETIVRSYFSAFGGARFTSIATGGTKFQNSVTDENIQPRIRAIMIMARSNDTGALVLSTGNWSEITMGYCTLYGDMAGGLNVIGNLPKTGVFDLSKWINRRFTENLIPQRTIDKPPSAELKADQRDTDSLPPYDQLDPVLFQLVEDEQNPDRITSATLSPTKVRELARRYRISEYKRQQMPPAAKISERSFGSGRRMPIACNRTVS